MGSRLSGEFHANAPIFLSYSRSALRPKGQPVRLWLKLVLDRKAAVSRGLKINGSTFCLPGSDLTGGRLRIGGVDPSTWTVCTRNWISGSKHWWGRFCAQIPIHPPTPSPHQSGFVEARQAGGWRTVWSILWQTRGVVGKALRGPRDCQVASGF